MDEAPRLPSALASKVIHGGLAIGLVVIGGTFFLILRIRDVQPPGVAPAIGLGLAGVSVSVLVLAITVLRGRVRPRRLEEASETYWTAADTRGPAIALWCVIQTAGVLGWIGYYLTGSPLAATAAAVALAALLLFRPSRLEGEGVP